MQLLASNYDVIFIAIILFSATLALIRGGVAEILSLSVWFLTFASIRHFGTTFDQYIPNTITNQLIRSSITFIIIFIVIAIFMAIIKRLCANIIKTIGLGGLNLLLGAGFGVLRGVLICAILVIIIEILSFDPSHAYEKSKLYKIINPVVEWIVQAIPKEIHELPKPPQILPG